MITETRHPHPHMDPRCPRDGTSEETNPPLFAWKPETTDGPFVLEVSRSASFTDTSIRIEGLEDPIYLPEEAMDSGTWFWRWGTGSDWAKTFSFDISPNAVKIEIPLASKWIAKLPTGHPQIGPGQSAEPLVRGLEEDGREIVSIGDTRFVVVPTGETTNVIGEVQVGKTHYQFGDTGILKV